MDGGSSSEHHKEVRLYDFSRPDRFSKDHLRAVNSVFSNYAAALTTLLTGFFRTITRAEIIGVDQVSYREYRASIPSKTLLAEIASGVNNQDFLMEVNPSIVGVWIDNMCGADPSLPSEASDLTPVDLAVASRVLNICIQAYADTWSSFLDIKPSVRRTVSSENFDDMFLPSETVLVVSFEVHAGPGIGMLTMCIPAAIIEAVLPALTAARAGRVGKHQDSAISGVIRQMLSPVVLPCKVMLGNSTITMADAAGLEIGDVIKVSKKADADIELWIGKHHMFNCRPGTRGKNMAVMITDVVTPIADVDLHELSVQQPVEMCPAELAA
jgi:flagellar motor switch protein FliM